MNPIGGVFTRRNLLRGGVALGASAFFVRGAYAEELSRTPSLTEGPFYPPKLPLDTDNDLLIINDKITPAVGDVTHLSGRVLSTSGEPMRNIAVEIWKRLNHRISLPNVHLKNVRLYETADLYVDYGGER